MPEPRMIPATESGKVRKRNAWTHACFFVMLQRYRLFAINDRYSYQSRQEGMVKFYTFRK